MQCDCYCFHCQNSPSVPCPVPTVLDFHSSKLASMEQQLRCMHQSCVGGHIGQQLWSCKDGFKLSRSRSSSVDVVCDQKFLAPAVPHYTPYLASSRNCQAKYQVMPHTKLCRGPLKAPHPWLKPRPESPSRSSRQKPCHTSN